MAELVLPAASPYSALSAHCVTIISCSIITILLDRDKSSYQTEIREKHVEKYSVEIAQNCSKAEGHEKTRISKN
jgi:hypothetical protein